MCWSYCTGHVMAYSMHIVLNLTRTLLMPCKGEQHCLQSSQGQNIAVSQVLQSRARKACQALVDVPDPDLMIRGTAQTGRIICSELCRYEIACKHHLPTVLQAVTPYQARAEACTNIINKGDFKYPVHSKGVCKCT